MPLKAFRLIENGRCPEATAEQALRVDRPPLVFSYTTSSASLPLKGRVRLTVSAPRSMPAPIRLKLHFSLYAPNQNPGEELAIYRPYVIFASNWDSPDSGIATIFPLASGIPLPDSIHVLANSGGAAGALKAARDSLLALPENQGLATLPANLKTFSEF